MSEAVREGVKFLSGMLEDARQLIRWVLSSNDKLKMLAMWVGGFSDVEQTVLLRLMEYPPSESVKFSTAVCNQTRWTLWKMVSDKKRLIKGDIVRRESIYSVNHTEQIERDELGEAVKNVLSQMKDERRREIILKRMNDRTFESIAKEYKISGERVSVLFASAIKRLENVNLSGELVFHC